MRKSVGSSEITFGFERNFERECTVGVPGRDLGEQHLPCVDPHGGTGGVDETSRRESDWDKSKRKRNPRSAMVIDIIRHGLKRRLHVLLIQRFGDRLGENGADAETPQSVMRIAAERCD